MGYESLYAYLVKALHYSESAAYRRIQAARLLKAVPEVAEKIESGSFSPLCESKTHSFAKGPSFLRV